MDVEYALKAGSKFTVLLRIDLKAYCDAYKSYREARALLLCNKLGEGVGVALIDRVKNEEKRRADIFYRLRNEYIAKLRDVAGDMHWLRIKELLKVQCDLTSPREKKLHEDLSASSTDHEVPLVIKCLDLSFIELLKNGIDAVLVNNLTNKSSLTTLEMTISLIQDADKLSVCITDNAGGASIEYLTSFNALVHTAKTKRIEPQLSFIKRVHKECCFGGAGLGLTLLANFLLRGELSSDARTFRAVYKVLEGATGMFLRNNEVSGGLELTLHSPIAPFTICLGLDDGLSEDEDVVTLSLPRTDDDAKVPSMLISAERARLLFKSRFASILFKPAAPVTTIAALLGMKRKVVGDERRVGEPPNAARRRVEGTCEEDSKGTLVVR